MQSLFKKLEETLRSGNNAVLCSIIASSGSTPRGAGAKMLVFSDGSIAGTIGGGAVEYKAICIAKEIHKSKRSFTQSFCLNKNDVADLGMICGGNVTVYFRYLSSSNATDIQLVQHINKLFLSDCNSWLITEVSDEYAGIIGTYDEENGLRFSKLDLDQIKPHLKKRGVLIKEKYFVEPLMQKGFVYIFGGGHVSQELVPVISNVGFRPIIFEDREKFTDIKLFAGAVNTILGDFNHPEEKLTITPDDYIVIMTRGHQADYDILEFAMRSPASYIGLIGSKSKMAYTQQKLREAGISEKDFPRIHNPIGLEIKAETPAEIAISIAAQLILHRAENN